MKQLKNLLTIFFILFSLTAFSQGKRQNKAREKMLVKQAEQKKKAQEDSVDEGKKRHRNIQTKETKKRMKKSAKRSKRLQDKKGPKKKFFLLRIFG